MGPMPGKDYKPRVLDVELRGIESIQKELPFESEQDKAASLGVINEMIRLGVDVRVVHREDGA